MTLNSTPPPPKLPLKKEKNLIIMKFCTKHQPIVKPTNIFHVIYHKRFIQYEYKVIRNTILHNYMFLLCLILFDFTASFFFGVLVCPYFHIRFTSADCPSTREEIMKGMGKTNRCQTTSILSWWQMFLH